MVEEGGGVHRRSDEGLRCMHKAVAKWSLFRLGEARTKLLVPYYLILDHFMYTGCL